MWSRIAQCPAQQKTFNEALHKHNEALFALAEKLRSEAVDLALSNGMGNPLAGQEQKHVASPTATQYNSIRPFSTSTGIFLGET